MSDAFERLWERFTARKKLGGRRLYETRLRASEWAGEGGVKLTRAEKAELFQAAVADPTGQMFEDIGRRRQVANKLEGTKEVPWDFALFLSDGQAKRQQEGAA